STMYNQASVLRTMELILGLHPMTTYDAGARPMFSVFGNTPSSAPYTALSPQTPMDVKNPPNTVAAKHSKDMRFDDADEIDDDELNAVLWAAIKGPDVPMPVPVASRFAH
ncbi:MAG TPA: hypothetical protein VFC21_03165, partial [Bryobacteraceae bacterium]|nr:hypothetical protein [Bryobacteraceae bacterium]